MRSKSSLVLKDLVSEVGSLSHFLSGRVLLCSPGWPRTHDPPASASQVLGILMYSSYTIIFVLLSWLNQPFLMVSWHFTRDEYLAGWGGGLHRDWLPKLGASAPSSQRLRLQHAAHGNAFRCPLAESHSWSPACVSFTVGGLSR